MAASNAEKQRLIEHYYRILTAGPRVDTSPPKCYHSSPLSIHYQPALHIRSSSADPAAPRKSQTRRRNSKKLEKSEVSEISAQNNHPLTKWYRTKTNSKLINMDCYHPPTLLHPKQAASRSIDEENQQKEYSKESGSTTKYDSTTPISSSDEVSKSEMNSLRNDLSFGSSSVTDESGDEEKKILRNFKSRVLDNIIQRNNFSDRYIVDVIEWHAQAERNLSPELMQKASREIMDELGIIEIKLSASIFQSSRNN